MIVGFRFSVYCRVYQCNNEPEIKMAQHLSDVFFKKITHYNEDTHNARTITLRPISVTGSQAQLPSLPHQFFSMMTLSLNAQGHGHNFIDRMKHLNLHVLWSNAGSWALSGRS
jgi:hypothetical protein